MSDTQEQSRQGQEQQEQQDAVADQQTSDTASQGLEALIHSEPAKKPKRSESLLLLMLLALGLSAFALGANLQLRTSIKQMQSQLSLTPPVVVVDFVKLAQAYNDAEGPELEREIINTSLNIQKLADAGYLVLDAANIVSAPDDVYLPVEAGVSQ